MSSRTLNRKQFLTLTVTSAAIAGFLQGCSDDATPTPPGGTGGTGTGGSAAGTGGNGTAGSSAGAMTGGGGSGTAGSGTAGGGAGGMTGGSGGAAAGGGGGAGGAAAGAGGKGGAGGSGGASGGTGGGGGSGGGGGGMCGSASIMHTSNNPHTHVPTEAGALATLKMKLKDLINGNMGTMEFTVPMDSGHDHKFKLTAEQVTTLKGGGTVEGVTTLPDGTNHMHTYKLSCMA